MVRSVVIQFIMFVPPADFTPCFAACAWRESEILQGACVYRNLIRILLRDSDPDAAIPLPGSAAEC